MSNNRQSRLHPVFVESIPETLKTGELYIAMEKAASMHLCPCGCGLEVALPIAPDGWVLKYDGIGITLRPSVGAPPEECASHYYIDANTVTWLTPTNERTRLESRLRDAEEEARRAIKDTPTHRWWHQPVGWLRAIARAIGPNRKK